MRRLNLIAGLAICLAGGVAQAQVQAPAQTQATSDAVVAPTAGNPNLAVASVKLEHGIRASKIIGASVYADANTTIGSVEDLIMTKDDKVTMAIVSVGGFVGLGGKLVAVPFDQLQAGPDGKLMLPGVSKDQLNAMPNFVY